MSGNLQVGVSIHDADEIGAPRLIRSHVAGQGVVTRFEINRAGISAYEGYGCPPAALAARLRELADQIDAAAAAMTPNQGAVVEAARTEGDAHQPAPASAVCDGGGSQDVAGAVVEADPAEEGDGVGAGPATAQLVEGRRYRQFTPSGQVVRIVELVQAGDTVSVVRACNGKIAGTEYEVPTARLLPEDGPEPEPATASRHVLMTTDYRRYREAGGVASWDTWALRYGDNYPESV